MKRDIILIAHNLRSCHNVGSLLRTADGLGIKQVYLTGYSPYPVGGPDSRLPHERSRIQRQIHKTALGAENTTMWQRADDIRPVINQLKAAGYTICALEQTTKAIALPSYQPTASTALIIGREVEGLEPDVVAQADYCLEIPMFGHKESFNVVQAAAMALYHLRFTAYTK
ncbi:TrmH family RNA methyltransferase [Candidatus Saccharibacteria bacterium]|nr:TrmH family RNA methyltransferase [Candidatus Saccharibacteria bacterium]